MRVDTRSYDAATTGERVGSVLLSKTVGFDMLISTSPFSRVRGLTRGLNGPGREFSLVGTRFQKTPHFRLSHPPARSSRHPESAHAAVAQPAAHRLRVHLQAFGDLLDREQLLLHGYLRSARYLHIIIQQNRTERYQPVRSCRIEGSTKHRKRHFLPARLRGKNNWRDRRRGGLGRPVLRRARMPA